MINDMVHYQIICRGIKDANVLDAMRAVDRSLFVPDAQKSYSFDDTPLPIGYGQTISQPFIVAYMTEQLELDSQCSVLEVGTGSGYQTAVLSSIAEQVFSIEAVPELAQRAQTTLRINHFDNAMIKVGDGFWGWKEYAPYDAIIVTAAAPSIPEPLFEQLKEKGRMIIPIGPEHGTQYLTLIRKIDSESVTERLIAVRFVPFVSGNF